MQGDWIGGWGWLGVKRGWILARMVPSYSLQFQAWGGGEVGRWRWRGGGGEEMVKENIEINGGEGGKGEEKRR